MAQDEAFIELRSLASLDTLTYLLDKDDHSPDNQNQGKTNTNYSNVRSFPRHQDFRRDVPAPVGAQATSLTPSVLPLLEVQEPYCISPTTFQNPVYDHLSGLSADGSPGSSKYGWDWDRSSIHTEGKGPQETSMAKEICKKDLLSLHIATKDKVQGSLTPCDLKFF
ncbi:hypothetical protein ElyMa_000000300 [Elysia marginata]|uniref:Uncharacterized protein n=1 Tax=Elysia marginata TaxID=1093978 RepID=A0AAV4EA55_9GAST|nr:hypothetical protein ElyMa_000000300 [Elysia marginata]